MGSSNSKLFWFLSFLFCLTAPELSAQREIHHRVKIYTDHTGIKTLSLNGVAMDHGDLRPGVSFTGDFSTRELEIIQSAGFRYKIEIPDVSSFYAEQSSQIVTELHKHALTCPAPNQPIYTTPSKFSLGSMGGYFTYNEMLAHLDTMAALYPGLITLKQPLGADTTFEGRPVYFVKISDNPNVNEPEPHVLYTAVHHAREPGAMSQLIYYMYYLLENYATDSLVKYLVDQHEMYFVTCLNPDGYIYNQTTDPNGGGMWRKNRRNNGDGTFGVDLNRNYGYNWGLDNIGSSPTTNSEVYRGTTAFSEPESRLLSDFINQKQIKVTLNYHTYGNLLIYPWGYQPSIFTPDSAQYVNYGALLTRFNRYTHGTADQTVGYVVNGSSDDWMYGEQSSKPKIFAMTPECGHASEGFWPPSNRIVPICKENIWPNIQTTLVAGKYATVHDHSPGLLTAQNGFISYRFNHLGMDTTGTYTVSLVPVSGNISFNGSPKVYIQPGKQIQFVDSAGYTLSGVQNGSNIRFLLSVNNGFVTLSDTITKYFGSPSLVYSHNGNTISGWNTSSWGISNTIFFSPSASITDSPLGDYLPNASEVITLSNPVSLSGALKATLKFWARWEIESRYDYVQAQVSANNGPWIPLCGKYTKPGSGANQPLDEPVYDGFRTSWVKEEISLDDYLGQNIRIRFLIGTDGWAEYDGFYFDDLEIEILNQGPSGLMTHPEYYQLSQCIPNPSSGLTEISYSLTGELPEAEFTVHDAMGRTLFVKKIENRSGRIVWDTSEWPSGIFFCRISGKDSLSRVRSLVVSQ
jgi:carboxypeptidase T